MVQDSKHDLVLIKICCWAISNPERWCCESAVLNMPGNLENSAVATGLEKVSFHSNLKERQCQRKLYCTIALTSYTGKVVLKILQARLQQYVNCELPDVQASFRKGTGTRGQIANICWIIKKAREFQKNIYFCFIDYAKAFDYVDHSKPFFKRWEYKTTWPASWEICMQVRKQQLELDVEQQAGSK